jgi:uncharacterized membrane protein YkvA (DUF1232 family)
VFDALKQAAKRLKLELNALALACRDPRTPWYAKALVLLVIAYAVSPIDLIPDPIPVLGYLDDLLLLPIGITLALRMIPPEVMTECRAKATEQAVKTNALSWIVAAVIALLWVGLAAVVLQLAWRYFPRTT